MIHNAVHPPLTEETMKYLILARPGTRTEEDVAIREIVIDPELTSGRTAFVVTALDIASQRFAERLCKALGCGMEQRCLLGGTNRATDVSEVCDFAKEREGLAYLVVFVSADPVLDLVPRHLNTAAVLTKDVSLRPSSANPTVIDYKERIGWFLHELAVEPAVAAEA